MIISTNTQSIEFWEGDDFEKLKLPAISLSGGADSAMLLYLLAQQDIDIIRPYFLHRYDLEQFLGPAETVVSFMQTLFPNKIADLELKDITGREWSIVKTNFEMTEYMEKTYNCDIFLTGSSANPPITALVDDNEKRILERDFTRHTLFKKEDVSGDRLYYRPFSNVNKRFVAELYKQYNLIDTLFPLTLSCIETNNTTHCQDCWWCKERYWAFDSYV
tara:strand:+ start:5113 stop:5766 length:654 start_codon:yes stop_codon:yes gene_type:complete